MPIYEYECPQCGVLHEVVRAVSKRNDTHVCDCSTETVRVWSEPAIETDKPYRTGKHEFPSLNSTPGFVDTMTFGEELTPPLAARVDAIVEEIVAAVFPGDVPPAAGARRDTDDGTKGAANDE